jgi:hypothetical protein
MTYILRDCVENNCVYCILRFTDTNIRRIDIDNAINDIKNKFAEENFDEWCVDDILNELSMIYDFEIFNFDGFLEV